MPHITAPNITEIRHIHLIAIAGVGMATLAVMLKEQGYRVTGSDQAVYPPMSEVLAQVSIPVVQGYHAHNLVPAPDLVVVGNAVSRTNPEVSALLGTEIPYLSFPEALRCFFLKDKRSLVVAGTHGKTTSTALLAWVLEKAGRRPGLLVGGVSKNFGRGYLIGQGEFFVVEGDEYDSAFFDKGPKFLHYQPQAILLNAIEFDHADIYRDLAHIKEAFGRLLAIAPTEAPILVCRDFPEALAVAQSSGKPFSTFGLVGPADWQARELVEDGSGFSFVITHKQQSAGRLRFPLMGKMNIRNALGVSALACELGLSFAEIAPGIESFLGVERRQDLIGEAKGITVIDDFAHHPTAVAATLDAVRMRYPNRRLWAAFEPRSNTCRRRIFQKPLAQALSLADRVVIGSVFTKPQDALNPDQLFSPTELAADLQAAGKGAYPGSSVDDLCTYLADTCRPGDIVVIMSNGAFGGLPHKLLAALHE